MTEAEALRISSLARHHRVATGAPLYVPLSMHRHLSREGVDMSNIAPTVPMPIELVRAPA